MGTCPIRGDQIGAIHRPIAARVVSIARQASRNAESHPIERPTESWVRSAKKPTVTTYDCDNLSLQSQKSAGVTTIHWSRSTPRPLAERTQPMPASLTASALGNG